MKLLLGTITWCPYDKEERAKQQIRYLDGLLNLKKTNDLDILVVDNNSTNPLLKEYLNNIDCEVIYNGENWGWAVGRNQMMQYYSNSVYDLLVMQDSDVFFEDDDWPKRLCTAFDKVPWLHVCQIRTTDIGEEGKGDFTGMKCSNGVIFNTFSRFIGGTNAIDRVALATLGGYDWKSIPFVWGYHDPEYGCRLEMSKMHSLGPNLDPVRVKKGIHDPERCGMRDSASRGTIARKVGVYFDKQIAKVKSGQASLFFDYTELPNPGEIK